LNHATLLLAATVLAEPVQVVVVGDEAAPGFTELFAAAAAAAVPTQILQRVPPGSELPASHPAAGKRLLDRRAAAYVCFGSTCEAPVTDPSALRARLARPVAAG
jgi:uncharacterized protein YyaL (SSP411 family)